MTIADDLDGFDDEYQSLVELRKSLEKLKQYGNQIDEEQELELFKVEQTLATKDRVRSAHD